MPRAWRKTRGTNPTADTTITTTTETVAATLSGLSTPAADSDVVLSGTVQVTAGTGTTALVVRVRRGTDATGTLIGEAETDTTTAGNLIAIAIQVRDTPGEVSNQSYVITVQQTGASGNGTISNAALKADY